MRWLKDWILKLVVSELQIGAHCGLCGRWVEHKIIYRSWPWTVCEECSKKRPKKESER